MRCWHCETELIWGGDHDLEEDGVYSFVTNLSCPKCYSFVEVYYPQEETTKNDKNKGDEYAENVSKAKSL
jgi:phage FluMu protein Com